MIMNRVSIRQTLERVNPRNGYTGYTADEPYCRTSPQILLNILVPSARRYYDVEFAEILTNLLPLRVIRFAILVPVI